MLRPIACAVALTGFTATADASVYRYDLQMKLANLDFVAAYVQGTGGIPGWLRDASCERPYEEYPKDFSCDGVTLDIRGNRLGIEYAERFDRVLTASLLLDTDFSSSGGVAPNCEGTFFICSRFNGRDRDDYLNYSATSDGFDVGTGHSSLWFDVSSEGIQYEDDGYFDAQIGNTWVGMGFIRGTYETTKLDITEIVPVPLANISYAAAYEATGQKIAEIAPVPLPASLPLLGVGIAAIGFAKRRKAKRSA